MLFRCKLKPLTSPMNYQILYSLHGLYCQKLANWKGNKCSCRKLLCNTCVLSFKTCLVFVTTCLKFKNKYRQQKFKINFFIEHLVDNFVTRHSNLFFVVVLLVCKHFLRNYTFQVHIYFCYTIHPF